MEDKRYQIFISSTFTDLKAERSKVIQTILNLKCFPAGIELFPAMDEEQFEYIKRIIDDSDYYLLIIGGRYGSVDKNGISWTEKEYDYAVNKGIPVIAFILKDETYNELPQNKTDNKRKKLADFKKKVSTERLIAEWSNEDNLALAVYNSLQNAFNLRPCRGWVKAKPVISIENLNKNLIIKNEKDSFIFILNNDVKFKMVFVEGGTFFMGATAEQENYADSYLKEDEKQALKKERPVQKVELPSYWIGETPVTQELWEAVMGYNPSRFAESHRYKYLPNRPVEQVTWLDCKRFINELNNVIAGKFEDGMKFNLPSEAQWEFAARGGQQKQETFCVCWKR